MRYGVAILSVFFLTLIGAIGQIYAQAYWLRTGSFAYYTIEGGFFLENRFYSDQSRYGWKCIELNSTHALLEVSLDFKSSEFCKKALIWVSLEDNRVLSSEEEPLFHIYWLPSGISAPGNMTVGRYGDKIFYADIHLTMLDVNTPYKKFKAEDLFFVMYYSGVNASSSGAPLMLDAGVSNFHKDTRLMISSDFDPVLTSVLGVELHTLAQLTLEDTNVFEPILAEAPKSNFLSRVSLFFLGIFCVFLVLALFWRARSPSSVK